MSACCLPHVVVFFEQSIVFNCPLLELHVYTAAVDADDASDAAARWKDKEKERAVRGTFVQLWHCTRLQTSKQTNKQKKHKVTSVFWDGRVPHSTLSVMRVLSFMVAVRAKPLVAGDDMWDCRTVSKASRTSSSLTWQKRVNYYCDTWLKPRASVIYMIKRYYYYNCFNLGQPKLWIFKHLHQ